MISQWFYLKSEAIQMRKKGTSIKTIEKSLHIPRSTLSGWLKHINLTSEQKIKLENNRKDYLVQARAKAVLWHNQQKINRLKDAEEKAVNLLSNIDTENKSIQELALAMLYLGEGFKANPELGIGNSNPLILQFFIHIFLNNFKIDRKSIRCELHLRADQNPNIIKKYWSQKLNLPLENFGYTTIDKRTIGSTTYSHYNGVCVLRCGNVALQRKIMYIAQKYCEKVVRMGG